MKKALHLFILFAITIPSLLAQCLKLIPNPPNHSNSNRGYDGKPFEFNGELYLRYLNNDGVYHLCKYDGDSVTLIIPNPPITTSSRGYFRTTSNTFIPYEFNGEIFLAYENNDRVRQLYKYDGTNLTLIPNPPNHNNLARGYEGVAYEFNGELFFQYRNDNNLYQLYKYDGTNLTLIPNPPNSTTSGKGYQGEPFEYNGELYLKYNNDNSVFELYKYNGISLTLIPNPPNHTNASRGYTTVLSEYNGDLLLAFTNNNANAQIYKYDGVSLTLIPSPPNSTDVVIESPYELNGELYFRFKRNTSNFFELYKYNGTSFTLIPNPSNHTNSNRGCVSTAYEFNGELFYRFQNNDNFYQLYKYDGTSLVLIPNPPNHTNGSRGYMGNPYEYEGELFLRYEDNDQMRRLYRYNGTSLTMIASPPNHITSGRGYFGDPYEYNGGLFLWFRNDNPINTNQMYLLKLPLFEWLGTTDSDWNNANNWNQMQVPAADNQIAILTGASNYPIVNNLNIDNCLTIESGATMTVSGDLINDATITLKSGATILTNGNISGSGIYNVEQFLKGSGGATPNGRFYYMGTPVTGANTSVFNPEGNNRFWTHTEVTGLYTRILDNATSLEAGGGYSVRMGADETVVYTSNTLNNGNYTFAGLSNTAARPNAERGYHLWSNPYPSQLDWDLVNKTNVISTFHLRTQNTSNTMVFDTYNAASGVGTNNNGSGALTKHIAPFQAIWIRLNNNFDPGTIAVNNSMRSHQSGNLLKSNSDQEIIRLHLSNGSDYDETVIYMHANANNDLDAFDSQKMMDEHHQMFSVEAGSKLVLNGIENANVKESVQLGIKIDYSGNYSIEANELNTMENVVLEDKKVNKLHDLKTNPRYVFTTTQGEDLNRFVLHFNKKVDQTTSNQLAQSMNDEVRIFAFNGNQVKVIIDDKAFENANINVYNMLGALVSSQKAESRENILSLDVATGIYMVELVSKEKVSTQKVMIK
jgi:hypothetical protein